MKKADLSIQTIAIAIIILIVLVVLIIAFKSQLAELFNSFKNIITGAGDSASNINFKEIFRK